MAKAKTLKELENELGEVEQELYDEETISEELDEALGFLNGAAMSLKDDERKAVKEAEKVVREIYKRHHRLENALTRKQDQLERQVSVEKAKGCSHEHLKCADCGRDVVEKK